MKALKIFIACACGAFIGVLTGKQISNSFFSILGGMLGGGLVGYVIYDLKGFLQAVKSAWQATTSKRALLKLQETYFHSVEVILAFNIMIGVMSGIIVTVFLTSSNSPIEPVIRGAIFKTAAVSIVLSGVLFMFHLIGLMRKDERVNFGLLRDIAGSKSLIADIFAMRKAPGFLGIVLLGNPFLVPFLGLYAVARFGYRNRKAALASVSDSLMSLKIVTTVVATWVLKFAKTLFILVHSDVRTICFCDAAIGAGVGIYFGYNALLGAFIGGILGVLNYYIVSIKLLKLKPTH